VGTGGDRGAGRGGRFFLCGAAVDALSAADAADVVARVVAERRAGRLRRALTVLEVDAGAVALACRDAAFGRDLCGADLLLASGGPVRWMAAALGAPLPPPPGTGEVVARVAARCGREGASALVIGTAAAAAEAARLVAASRPAPALAGVVEVGDGFAAGPDEVGRICGLASAAGAEVIFVALAPPIRERFMSRARDLFPAAALVAAPGPRDGRAGAGARALGVDAALLSRFGVSLAARLAGVGSSRPLRRGARG